MTMREIFKKVATYNEVAETLGNEKVEIMFIDYENGHEVFDPADYSEFKKTIYNLYTAEAADAIKTETRFELNRDCGVRVFANGELVDPDWEIGVRLVAFGTF